jgi:hypothetical protein
MSCFGFFVCIFQLYNIVMWDNNNIVYNDGIISLRETYLNSAEIYYFGHVYIQVE